jgi:hypothetical protein
MTTSRHTSSSQSPDAILQQYFQRNFKVVFWPAVGDQKGPKAKDWPRHPAQLSDYCEGDRVGILTGVEIAPGHFLHDVDIDWAPGYDVAAAFLPKTEFIYGRSSKHVSHCFYTLSEPLPRGEYKDPVDGTMLLEIRGTKENGELGWQSMAPPSTWSKEGKHEQLTFRKSGDPSHFEDVVLFRQRVALGAIGMLFAKCFGKNGFGHEVRLAWAGFLLRASVAPEDIIKMGEAMSVYCNNREVHDVRQVVESTVTALAGGNKKVKGGPALAKMIGEGGKKVISEVSRWLGRDSDFVRVEGVIVKDNQDNVRHAVALLGFELQYQEFAEKMLVTGPDRIPHPIDDRILNNIWLRIDRECRFRPTFTFFEKVLTDAAYDNTFHPVRDYLAGLEWDEEPRIDGWLATYGGAIDAGLSDYDDSLTYLEAISSIVLIAAVRRVLHPGCKYDEMLVLESQQGFNKSGALRALCPKEEWFSDDLPLNVDAKEIIERTLGKWIIEASDLVGGRKAERDHLKSMLSRQVDGPARMAYAHIPVERPRQFIIIGSTNDKEYLADATGSRRFWPVKVKRFDVAGIINDRDQLWAEAVVREVKGESIRLPERLWASAGEHQERRREVDAWEDILYEVAVGLEPASSGAVRVATNALWEKLGIEPARRDRLGAKRISEIMQRLGFERVMVRDAGKVQVGYEREEALDSGNILK